MKTNNALYHAGRRQFLSSIIPICGLSSFGCGVWLTPSPCSRGDQEKHKFEREWGHTYEQAFRWKFEYIIALMKQFSEYLGKDRLLEMLRNAGDEISRRNAKNDPNFSFDEWMKGGQAYFQNMMTREIIERTDKVCEIRVSECLWHKIFKEYDATDIGYAYVCYNDFAAAREAHPKVKLERTKTLMQGHDCCNHRWIWQG